MYLSYCLENKEKTMTKICTKCKIEKDFGEFYKRNNKPRSWCKECEKADNNRRNVGIYQRDKERITKYREENREKLRGYYKNDYCRNKERRLSQHREWRENNKEWCKEQNARYYQDHKKELTEYEKNRLKQPGKRAAYNESCKLHRWYENNNIKTPVCCMCGSNKEINFHHDDYSKPHIMVPLCKYCHTSAHYRNPNGYGIRLQEDILDTSVICKDT